MSRTTALENVELPMMYNGFAGNERHRAGCGSFEFGWFGPASRLHAQLIGFRGAIQRVAIARALVNKPSLIFADVDRKPRFRDQQCRLMGLFQHLNSDQVITIIQLRMSPTSPSMPSGRSFSAMAR